MLGVVTYGLGEPLSSPDCFGSVPLPVLPGGGAIHTAWCADGSFVTGARGKLHYRHNEHVLFGFITLNEADFPPGDKGSALQQTGYAAYSLIFETIKDTGFPHLVRCWNYLPRINVADDGLERYRHFNVGRQEAFISARHSHLAGAPSACALGTTGGDLVVYFLASRAEPHAIENPRQMSAYHYPDQYGPSSPTFSRATLLPLPGAEALFVSGTASILGHESLHHGDVAEQTAETLRNIGVVVEQANLKSCLGKFSIRDLCMKAFIRRKEDMETVSRILREQVGSEIDVIWLQADICRAELMVEIEAFGFLGRV